MQQNDFVYDHILIRYGELSTKGKNRKDFIRRLHTNVKHALNMFEAIEIEKTHDRMYIHLNETDPFEIKPYLEKIFGISSFSFAVREDQKCGAGAGIKKSGQNLQGRCPPQLETVSDDF